MERVTRKKRRKNDRGRRALVTEREFLTNEKLIDDTRQVIQFDAKLHEDKRCILV